MMAKLKFKKYLRYDEPYWFSGVYKICEYTDVYSNKFIYRAYYILATNWGDCVDKAAKIDGYKSLEDAQTACQVHADNNPQFCTDKNKLKVAAAALERSIS